MRRLTRWGRGAALAALLCAGPAAAGDGGAGRMSVQYGGPTDGGSDPAPGKRQASTAAYHGFRIEFADRSDVGHAALLAAAEHQIDIVERAGVSASMLAVFRRVPIHVSASFVGSSHYSGGREVDLGATAPGDDRPVLLHEYMHVLEFKTFPGRFRNPTVQRYFEEAQAGNLFPEGSYMMSNPWEFFAMTASCYLNGTVAREPYSRAAIRERQPDYYAYLQSLFGPRGDTAAAAADRARL